MTHNASRLFPDIHRAAHDPQRVVVGQVRDRLALVERHGPPCNPVIGQEIAEDAWMLDFDVLKDDDMGLAHRLSLP